MRRRHPFIVRGGEHGARLAFHPRLGLLARNCLRVLVAPFNLTTMSMRTLRATFARPVSTTRRRDFSRTRPLRRWRSPLTCQISVVREVPMLSQRETGAHIHRMPKNTAEPATHVVHISWNHRPRFPNLLLQVVRDPEQNDNLYTCSDL